MGYNLTRPYINVYIFRFKKDALSKMNELVSIIVSYYRIENYMENISIYKGIFKNKKQGVNIWI